MKVIATATGYDNVCIRNEGDIFDMPEFKADGVTPLTATWYKKYSKKRTVEVEDEDEGEAPEAPEPTPKGRKQ